MKIDGDGSNLRAADESGGLQRPGAGLISESTNSGSGIVSTGSPLLNPGKSLPPDRAGDLSAVLSAEATAEGDDGQAAGNPPAGLVAIESTATRNYTPFPLPLSRRRSDRCSPLPLCLT